MCCAMSVSTEDKITTGQQLSHQARHRALVILNLGFRAQKRPGWARLHCNSKESRDTYRVHREAPQCSLAQGWTWLPAWSPGTGHFHSGLPRLAQLQTDVQCVDRPCSSHYDPLRAQQLGQSQGEDQFRQGLLLWGYFCTPFPHKKMLFSSSHSFWLQMNSFFWMSKPSERVRDSASLGASSARLTKEKEHGLTGYIIVQDREYSCLCTARVAQDPATCARSHLFYIKYSLCLLKNLIDAHLKFMRHEVHVILELSLLARLSMHMGMLTLAVALCLSHQNGQHSELLL